MAPLPWALEQTPMPASGSDAGVDGLAMGTPVTLEDIVSLGRQIGFAGRFQVAAPKDEKGVWTLSQDSMSYDSPNPTTDRTVHIDQYTGKILATVAYADYSLAGKSMAVGISLHEGQMGLWNVVLNIEFCLLMIFVAISGAVMWWKRRPVGAGRLTAPPAADAPMKGAVVLIAVLLSMGFPMLGFTLIAVLTLDVLVLQNLPGLKRLLS